MYIPEQYINKNLDEVTCFIKQNSFGILVSTVKDKPWATHIPLELEICMQGNSVLYGHISKVNEQWKYFKNDASVLAIFNGPHAYVSSSWYEHEEVPTWNYIAVHVYGKITILDDDELLFSLKKLVDKYEQHSENPVKIENLSAETMRQIKGVVGFKMSIDTIQAAYKLSQNRNDKDYQNIICELSKNEDSLVKNVACIMREKR